MKMLLVVLSGFVLTLTTYAGGALTAIFFMNAEPVPDRAPGLDTASVWTNEPVAVNSAQEFQRLPARPVAQQSGDATPEPATARDMEVEPQAEEAVDPITTASLTAEDPIEPEPSFSSAMNPAHVEWCADRYRSYRPGDNSYTPYGGGSRECISPYSETSAPEPSDSYAATTVDQPFVGYATEEEEPSDGYVTSDHVESCFARYRSYRPEDNSYQPYGGGPRRQCR